MPKGRIQLRLSETALSNLEQHAQAAGLTRQDYIEVWLTGVQAHARAGLQASERTAVEPAATVALLEPVQRKAVKAALPEPGEIIERIQQKIEERIGPAIRPEPCMHPASQRRGSKCLECGEAWK